MSLSDIFQKLVEDGIRCGDFPPKDAGRYNRRGSGERRLARHIQAARIQGGIFVSQHAGDKNSINGLKLRREVGMVVKNIIQRSLAILQQPGDLQQTCLVILDLRGANAGKQPCEFP